MILGQISFLDIAVFLIFLAPQLIIHVGLFGTIACGLKALPFLLIKLPVSFLYEHVLTQRKYQTPFVQVASLFEDLVIRCVRYAFSDIPASIGNVFFSKAVALPFLRFRMLRHGYFRSPIGWEEISTPRFKGVLITHDSMREPDIVIYYAHGGGFSMGSSYFYLEFLLTWTHLLCVSGFQNPAILALEYTLVPKACYPTQLDQAIAGYRHIITNIAPASRVCVSGDSAGATIILSLLLHLARQDKVLPAERLGKPAMSALISPWTTLVSDSNRNTLSDYLDKDSLDLYAHQYAGSKSLIKDPLVSPGECNDLNWWRDATPERGFFFAWGKEEVFAPEIRRLIGLLLRTCKSNELMAEKEKTWSPICEGLIEGAEAEGGIHAWPVASLFLSSSEGERLKGLRLIVQKIKERML